MSVLGSRPTTAWCDPFIRNRAGGEWDEVLYEMPPNHRLEPTAPPLASLAPALRLNRNSLGGLR